MMTAAPLRINRQGSPAMPESEAGGHACGLFAALACVLAGFGVVMVHSASITSWPSGFERVYLSRHLVFLALGVTVAAVCAIAPARLWYRAAPLLFAATAVLLVLVLIPGVGARVNGARRWLRVGPLSFQPSELAKITLVLFVCRLACRPQRVGWAMPTEGGNDQRPMTNDQCPMADFAGLERIGHWSLDIGHWWSTPTLLMIFAVSAVPALVLLQPDLGTALFLAAGCAIALYVAGWPLRRFLFIGAVAVPAVLVFGVLRPYQVQRITRFAAAWSDPAQVPYQVRQSLVTLGTGGTTGVGLGQGWQKLSFLPEANTDFVFAVVGEELGLPGTLTLLALWAALYLTGLRLLRPLPAGSFAAVAGFTLLTQVLLQAALNVAVVTGLVPPKGLPHPLLSYGGSNLVVTLASLGIVVGMSRRRPGGDCKLQIESCNLRIEKTGRDEQLEQLAS